LLLREHALACPINLKAIDDALHRGCSSLIANGIPDDGFESDVMAITKWVDSGPVVQEKPRLHRGQ
jgi:hypothetical protein